MQVALAAVGSIVAAVLGTSMAPYLVVGRAEPDFVLVFAISWTLVVGVDGGIVWAFLGGLMVDLLTDRPIGSTSFTLLIGVGIAGAIGRVVPRGRLSLVLPVATVFVFSLVQPLIFRVIYAALRGPVPGSDPIAMILPDAIYNAVLAAIVSPLLALGVRRLRERDRPAW